MRNLTANEKSFVKLMTESDEHARRGFELLLQRSDFAEYFDSLNEAGLFGAEKNSGPVPAEKEHSFRIPYWDALGYLEAVAKHAGVNGDPYLSEKILEVVRAVTNDRSEPDGPKDNYHTWRIFAEILANLPTNKITEADIDLIPVWLKSKFDTGLVGQVLGAKLLPHLLGTNAPEDQIKACRVLQHCTALRWGSEPSFGGERKKAFSVVDDYWLNDLLQKNAKALGEKAGKQATIILLDGLKEVFSGKDSARWSWLSRPAVEEHTQNHAWERLGNGLVESLRDAHLAWFTTELQEAKKFLQTLLEDDAEIARRIGIYVLNQKFEVARELFVCVTKARLFDLGHLHELYHLLSEKFSVLNSEEKKAVISAIRAIEVKKTIEDPEIVRRSLQRRWLSAISGKGSEQADQWFKELNADASLGGLTNHPDFNSYMETRWGPGPSPYGVPELLALADDGTIIQRLNEFEQQDSWRSPSIKALVDTLEAAVKTEPLKFAQLLPQFLNARRPYQYGVISGFKSNWDSTLSPGEKTLSDDIWKRLFAFFGQLILNDSFWNEHTKEEADLTPTRDWIPTVIADFIKAGMQNDEKSFAPALLPQALELIAALLHRLPAEIEANSTDAVSQAINSPKGRAIEALVNYALRSSRLTDLAGTGHAEAWSQIEPLFNEEIEKCQNGNFDFSTLMGNYIANLHYLSPQWVESNIEKIFPLNANQQNFASAVQGLAYAPATRPVYQLLMARGLIRAAIERETTGKHAKENLLERIALAYLWGDESLNSPTFHFIFSRGKEDELGEIAQFFWSVKNQKLSDIQIELILEFWRACMIWAAKQSETPKQLLSRLAGLMCYLNGVSEEQKEWLLNVAPYVELDYNAYEFMSQLDRLADSHPKEVYDVLARLLQTYKPYLDFEDRLRSLVLKIKKAGLSIEAVELANRLRGIKGFLKLYEEIRDVH